MQTWKAVKVVCQGITPLLMEPISDAVLESLRTGNRIPLNKDKKVEQIAADKIYRNGRNEAGIPADNFWSCLVEAGKLVSYKGKQKISTKEESLLGGLLRIDEEFLPLVVKNGDGYVVADGNGHDPEWNVDKRRGRLPDGTAVCLVRPRFVKWGFSATLYVNDKFVSPDKIKELVETAGTFKGIGGHRKKGNFGRFEIVEWKVSGDGATEHAGKKPRGRRGAQAAAAAVAESPEGSGEEN